MARGTQWIGRPVPRGGVGPVVRPPQLHKGPLFQATNTAFISKFSGPSPQFPWSVLIGPHFKSNDPPKKSGLGTGLIGGDDMTVKSFTSLYMHNRRFKMSHASPPPGRYTCTCRQASKQYRCQSTIVRTQGDEGSGNYH